jgi:penicillin-binding protein 1C
MKNNLKKFLIIFLLFLIGFLLFSFKLERELSQIYEKGKSKIILDREGREIAILPNEKGNFARYLVKIPPRLKNLLIKKEDKFFYWHFGFNPKSIFEAALGRIGIGSRKASSTISQQLVKILLGKEKERNLKNKIIESFYTLALEIFKSKEEILKMYLNSVYFGNQAQGIFEASRFYFGVNPDLLTDEQILQLLATIPDPNERNPAKKAKENPKYSRVDDSFFEISTLFEEIKENQLTIDLELTKKIREIVARNIEELKSMNAKNAAVIVIKLPENEILALIGSPDPKSEKEGYKINMLNQPRPIGSTIKPFIYLKAFEKGLRPYTLVEDREYKYITALGFPLYPKNFDWKYRGEVNLHYALSNSLNVPAVKVLEYVGLEDFYKFLKEDLEFKPVQDLENYQLGIALGVLEMDLFNLAKYFTIFPNEGILKDLKIFKNQSQREKRVAEEKYVQLVNKILTDRKTGIEQFGLKSELNLFQTNYGLKTGTSRDFKDSWIIGFTPDFLVGVWVGNADNSPTEGVSGQIGAGRIWSEVMELLLNSDYNKKTPFKFDLIKEYKNGENIEYGLEGDNFQKILNALKEMDRSLILNPHDGDNFLLEKNTKIILRAKESVKWFLNGEFFAQGKEIIFIPKKAGNYKIEAENFSGQKEEIEIFIFESI